jgi:hypothetical protein
MNVTMHSITGCCRFLANFLSHIQHNYSGITTHYGLFPKGTIQWKISTGKAQIRDRDFLASYVESRAIPWQFEFENVKYIMTCSMDTFLMTLYTCKGIEERPFPIDRNIQTY